MKRTPELPLSSAIIAAAGMGTRMGGNVRKPYLALSGKPILSWTLSALCKVPGLHQIVLVTRPEDRETALKAARLAKIPRRIRLDFAAGGALRQDSVLSGLKSASAKSELVLIHDAARPFPPLAAMIEACKQAHQKGAAILACKVKDTVKRAEKAGSSNKGNGAHSLIHTTVPRAGLWLAQTPQVFRRDLILELFEKLVGESPIPEVTDDASICEFYRQPVVLVESSDTNLKVTRPEDLIIARGYLRDFVKAAAGK